MHLVYKHVLNLLRVVYGNRGLGEERVFLGVHLSGDYFHEVFTGDVTLNRSLIYLLLKKPFEVQVPFAFYIFFPTLLFFMFLTTFGVEVKLLSQVRNLFFFVIF